MPEKYLKYLAAAICLSAALLLYGLVGRDFAGGTQKGAARGVRLSRVVRVFDGDTVGLMSGGRAEKLRLIGIDAPEMGQRPWGRRAKEHLEDIISSSSWTVTLEPDVEERDKYGRLLGYIRTADGRLINEMVVRDGYAVPYTIPPNVKYADLFVAAAREARQKRSGIWAGKGLRQEPSEYRRAHPERY